MEISAEDRSGTQIVEDSGDIAKKEHKESKEEMQRRQIQKQIMNLKIFFYTMSVIICFKYILQGVYDFFIFFLDNKPNVARYAFIVSFYTAEILIVLLMSKSI